MKNFLFAFVVILLDAMALPVGCESCRHNHDGPDEVSVSLNVINFDEDGGTMSVSVRSNTNWVVGGNPDWLTINPKQGNMNGDIFVAAQPNTEQASRNGEFYIVAGDASNMVKVYQSAMKPYLHVNTNRVLLENQKGASSVISVSSNSHWTVNNLEQWLQVSPKYGIGNAKIIVTAQSLNESPDERYCVITIDGGGVKQEIVVIQKGE